MLETGDGEEFLDKTVLNWLREAFTGSSSLRRAIRLEILLVSILHERVSVESHSCSHAPLTKSVCQDILHKAKISFWQALYLS